MENDTQGAIAPSNQIGYMSITEKIAEDRAEEIKRWLKRGGVDAGSMSRDFESVRVQLANRSRRDFA